MEILLFFSTKFYRCHYQSVKSTKKKFKKLCKSSHHGWSGKKNLISKISKTPVSSFWE